MKCCQSRDVLIELARGEQTATPLGLCENCVAFLDAQRSLNAAMVELRAQASAAALAHCPPLSSHRRLRRRHAPFYGAIAASVAAALALGTWSFLKPGKTEPSAAPRVAAVVQPAADSVPAAPANRPTRDRPKRDGPNRATRAAVRRSAPPAAAAAEPAPFISIPYTVPLSEGERAQIWRLDVPVSELLAAGFPVTARDPAGLAEADVVVGEDGRARAVRLVSLEESPSANQNRNRRIYK